MHLTHTDLKMLFRIMSQQQEDLELLTNRLIVSERALKDIAEVHKHETGRDTRCLKDIDDAHPKDMA